MRPTFFYAPVADLDQALAFYRDGLGLDEAWREGADCVVFELPDTELRLMVDLAPDKTGRGGPFYKVPNVSDFLRDHPTVKATAEPQPIPGGFWVAAEDPAGNAFYLWDSSADPTDDT